MEKFGEYLKSHRDKKGIRLEEIASITKIHLHSLELLEAGHWDQLPPEPFIRGFILAYAKYVGLDPKETITRYLEEAGGSASSAQNPIEPAPNPRSGRTASDVMENAPSLPIRKIVGSILAVGAIAAIVGIIYVGKRNSSSEGSDIAFSGDPDTRSTAQNHGDDSPHRNDPSRKEEGHGSTGIAKSPEQPLHGPYAKGLTVLPSELASLTSEHTKLPPGFHPPLNPNPPLAVKAETENKLPEVAKAHAPTGTSVPPSKVAPDPNSPTGTVANTPGEFLHEIAVEGKERTWIKVVIDEKPPIEYFLPQGEKTTYKAKNKIKVVLGNSTGSKVTHNGEVVKGEKFQGTIRSYIFPTGARFPQDVPSKRLMSSKPGGEGDSFGGDTPKEESPE